jgi:hypothetical protein
MSSQKQEQRAFLNGLKSLCKFKPPLTKDASWEDVSTSHSDWRSLKQSSLPLVLLNLRSTPALVA